MKEIKLTQGNVSLVDDEDFEYLNQWKWHVKNKRDVLYAAGWVIINGKQAYRYMHRLILNAGKNKIVDHRDRNPLNNQRNNLRICTRSENMRNRGKRAQFKSKYKGVCFNKESKKWTARIGLNGSRIFLGYFLTEIDAAKAYDIRAKELHGEFANPNFIQ